VHIFSHCLFDAIALSGGPDYPVPTRRRDGIVLKIEEVHIPGPTFSIDVALNVFESVGLNLTDLATLLGAHTIGFAHCGFFNDWMYDFDDSGMADPSMDPILATDTKREVMMVL
jgi:peroxidase